MFDKFLKKLCIFSFKRPFFFIPFLILLSILSYTQLNKVHLNMDPLILLPDDSKASILSKKLEEKVGQHHFFYLLFEGEDENRLIDAVEYSIKELKNNKDIKNIVYHYPNEFIKKYRYLLIPSIFLNMIEEIFIQWEAEINPLGDNLLEEFEESEGSEKKEYLKNKINSIMKQFGNLDFYFEGENNKSMGIILYPDTGLKDMKQTLVLFKYLKKLTHRISEKFGIWSDVGGALNRWIGSFKIVQSDIKRSGMVMITGILILLVFSFRSIKIIPILLLPLFAGLFFAIGIIPSLIGDLNVIASFFLVVSFGLGIDFAIHLVKRFQKEIDKSELEEALIRTFLYTGKSVILSALTTSLALFILSVSNFKGISEFGIVGGAAIVIILLTMILLMPSIMVIGYKFRLIKASKKANQNKALIPNKFVFTLIIFLLLFCLIKIKNGVRFDYDFSKMGPTVSESEKVKSIQDNIFSTSFPPAAFYIAKDQRALDQFLSELNRYTEGNPDTRIGWTLSIRDIFPSEDEGGKRIRKIQSIKQQLKAEWIDYIEDPEKENWIKNFRKWESPEKLPEFSEIPQFYLRPVITTDGSEEFLIGIFTRFERRDGKNAIDFTNEIYNLNPPEGVEGPIGESPVVSEIIQLVVSEGPWIFLSTFIGVFLLTFLLQRSFKQTLLILVPLISGMYLFIGILGISGLKINFYNIVVFPALLGMGVDDGIHYFRRFRESGNDIYETQGALFNTLTLTTFTTVLGYAGLMFARHQGLFTIGLHACIGLICIWITSLFLFPVLLRFIYAGDKRNPSE